jgi:hypothetical protein
MGSLGNGEDQYLAKPSGACCLKGTLHEGKSRGTFIDVAGVETYISKPCTAKANGHILLYFPDVWGMFPNGLLIMDGFADAGYLVLGLDYFRGVSYLTTYTFTNFVVPAKVLTEPQGSCLEA